METKKIQIDNNREFNFYLKLSYTKGYNKAIDDLKNKIINYYIEKGRKNDNPNPVIYQSEIITVLEQIVKELKK